MHDHFSKAVGRGNARTQDFNWADLDMGHTDLEGLDAPFTEEEAKSAINHMPCNKAPSPDGFTGAFCKCCWGIIKTEVMNAIHNFGNLHVDNFQWLNSANIVLLPKKNGAGDITEFRPIRLIHAIAKIITKMPASRLSPHMNNLVSNAQSAFIKKRSIHDNFMYVRNLASRLHKNKTPSILFSIRKAFDSVRWEYVLDILHQKGFPSRFRDWIVAPLRTSSSRVLLNGVPGSPIIHGRGIREGDPMSPLLFVIAIDLLQQLLNSATRLGLLHKIRWHCTIVRTSLYADDAAVFVAPIREDIQKPGQHSLRVRRGHGVAH